MKLIKFNSMRPLRNIGVLGALLSLSASAPQFATKTEEELAKEKADEAERIASLKSLFKDSRL